jgi:hypothetical protein
MPLQILSERILNNATLLSVLSGIVDFIKLLILNSHLINAIEISELFDCGHYGELRATYCFFDTKKPAI